MSYKFTTGSVRRGDIYFEDDTQGELTYIDFGYDTITLRPSGSAILYVEANAVGIGTTSPDNTLHVESLGTTHIKIASEAGYEAALKLKSGTEASAYVWQPGNTSDLRFYVNGADVMHLDNDGNVGIGTTTPDNKLTVVGGHISSDGGVKSGTVHFSWSARTTSFGAGTADLVSYISFGNNSVWGWVEVTLTDDHIGTQTTGKYTKRYQIGRNIDQDHVGHQSFEVPANIGSVVDQWNLGEFEVDSNDLRIPIHRLTTKQNSVTVFVEGQLHVASLDTVDNVLNSLSLSTPAVVSNSATRDYYSIMSDRVGIGTTTPYSTLQIAGSLQFKVSQLSGDTTLDDTHHVISADCNAASVVVTLPTVSENIAGRVYIIKRADTGGSGGGNSLTIARNGANIDGAASDLSSIENGTSHTLICLGGAGWIIVDKYVGV
jgi:hypothetical protein